jgi:hypothetical protein
MAGAVLPRPSSFPVTASISKGCTSAMSISLAKSMEPLELLFEPSELLDEESESLSLSSLELVDMSSPLSFRDFWLRSSLCFRSEIKNKHFNRNS